LSWPKQPGATKPFEDPFDRLTVLSKVEGLKASREIQGCLPAVGSIYRKPPKAEIGKGVPPLTKRPVMLNEAPCRKQRGILCAMNFTSPQAAGNSTLRD
jgi:hypothetical protein